MKTREASGWAMGSGECSAAGGEKNRSKGEILGLRGADDGRSRWLRKYTTGCGRKKGPNGDTVSNLGLEIIASVTICQVRN